ncbi:hypothetical protein [Alteriqipengyuania sp. 357]
MKTNRIANAAAIAVAATLVFALPLAAQEVAVGDGGSADAGEAKTPEQILVEEAELEARRLTAQQSIVDSQVKLLTPPAFSNNTSLSGEGAGALETTMLGSYVVQATAKKLRDTLKSVGDDKEIVVLAQGEAPAWGDALVINRMLEKAVTELRERTEAYQSRQSLGGGGRLPASFGPPTIAAGTQVLASLLSRETTVSSVPFKASNTLLLDMLVGTGGTLKRPGDRMSLNENNATIVAYGGLSEAVDRAKKAQEGATTADKETAQYQALQASLTGAEALIKNLTTPDASGRRPIYNLARYSKLLENSLIATVNTEFSSGSAIKRKSFLRRVTLKDPVVMTAGMVVSYSLVDPTDGARKATGILQCRTGYYGLDWLVLREPDDKADERITVFCEPIKAP